MNQEIENILSNLIINGKKIEYGHLKYKGKKTTYITYHEILKEPRYADDYPYLTIYTYDFDIYSKGNYLELEKILKEILLDNNWIWVEDNEDEFEEDSSFYHKTLTFRKEI